LYTRQRAIKNGPSRDTGYIVHKTRGNQEWAIQTQSTLYTRQRAIMNGPSRDTEYIVHKTTGNQEWTIQRHRVRCTQDNGQSRMDHPETQSTLYTRQRAIQNGPSISW